MENKQTAVEWLVTYMLENFHLTDESLQKFEQAKEMEKEQIEEAKYYGFSKGWDEGANYVAGCK